MERIEKKSWICWSNGNATGPRELCVGLQPKQPESHTHTLPWFTVFAVCVCAHEPTNDWGSSCSCWCCKSCTCSAHAITFSPPSCGLLCCANRPTHGSSGIECVWVCETERMTCCNPQSFKRSSHRFMGRSSVALEKKKEGKWLFFSTGSTDPPGSSFLACFQMRDRMVYLSLVKNKQT